MDYTMLAATDPDPFCRRGARSHLPGEECAHLPRTVSCYPRMVSGRVLSDPFTHYPLLEKLAILSSSGESRAEIDGNRAIPDSLGVTECVRMRC